MLRASSPSSCLSYDGKNFRFELTFTYVGIPKGAVAASVMWKRIAYGCDVWRMGNCFFEELSSTKVLIEFA